MKAVGFTSHLPFRNRLGNIPAWDPDHPPAKPADRRLAHSRIVEPSETSRHALVPGRRFYPLELPAGSKTIDKLAPHDLRRTCARLCHEAGGELEQVQFLLGHVSVQTTEKYLECKPRLRQAVNEQIGIEPILPA